MYRVLPRFAPYAAIAVLTAAALPVTLQAGRSLPRSEIATAQAAIVDGPDDAAAAAPSAREFPRAHDGLFYVTAKINGQPVRFLVDTGASVVVLSARDAARAGVADKARYDARIETAGGKAAMAWTTIAHVEVAGRHVRDLRAAVVRQEIGVSLLGQNALSKLGPVTIEGDRLRMG